MPYSSDQFKEDWVYATGKDFKSQDGTPATYAAGQPAYYGTEVAKIELNSSSNASSVNSDGTLLAVEQGHNVHVYKTQDQALFHVLKGHESRIDAIEFHPTNPTKMVTCAMNNYGGSVEAPPKILFWDLSQDPMGSLLSESSIERSSQSAVQETISSLEAMGSSWRLDDHMRETLAKGFAESIEKLNVKSRIKDNESLSGRLVASFGSRAFSSDGSRLVYLPGNRPRSNQVDHGWVICVWDTVKKETTLTLTGHTDSLMWVGFSPDDKFIASVCWDQTFKIWSAADGSLLHTFRSSHQNWTGGFSPDSRFFAGTSVGQLWVWDVIHGVEVATYIWERGGWRRTLDWSPSGKQLAVGGGDNGSLTVFDVKTQTVVQERTLSLDNCAEDVRRMMRHLEVHCVQYFDQGRKIVYRTSGDNGVEVYDFETNQKWRFAQEKGGGAYGRGIFLLDGGRIIASDDGDAIRFWRLDSDE